MKSPAAMSVYLAFLCFALASCGGDGDGDGDLAFVDSESSPVASVADDPGGEGDGGATTTSDRGVTTSSVAPTTTSTGAVAETIPDGLPAQVAESQRIDFELFRYSVDVPPGFRVEFASGRNGYLVSDEESTDGVFSAYFDVTNFLPGDEPSDFTSFVGDGEVQSQETIEVPIYRTSDLSVTVPGLFVEATEVHLVGGFYGDQWIRIYELGDRSIVASVSIGDGFDSDVIDPHQVLDGVRLWEGNFVARSLEQCSTLGLAPIKVRGELNPAQQATVAKISDALTSCDWSALAAMLGPEFIASFGGDDAIELWRDAERYGDSTVRTLYGLLSLPVFIEPDTGLAVWPRAAALSWSEVDDGMMIELEQIGYREQDFIWFEDFGGYFGFRTGIDTDGTWQYYVAGD